MSFNNALETIVSTSCTHGSSCPMHVTLQNQKIISYSLIGLLVLIGIIISYFMKDEKVVVKPHKQKEISAEERKQKLEHLGDEERKIMDLVLREEGSIYQSDIIKEVNLSKVRVTRILDKLEGKGLIERKRRGMTNIIIANNLI